MTDAIAERFERYEGSGDYHFGMSVEGYVLAATGFRWWLRPSRS